MQIKKTNKLNLMFTITNIKFIDNLIDKTAADFHIR